MIRIFAITEGELLFGLGNNPAATPLHKDVGEFMRRTTVLAWDSDVAPLDMLIAAPARGIKAILVSSDSAFQIAPGLAVESG